MKPIPSKVLIILAFIAIYIIWGSTYLMNKVAVTELPAFFLASFRFFCASILIFTIASISGKKLGITKRQFRNSVFVAFLFMVSGNGLFVWALKYVDSGFAALWDVSIQDENGNALNGDVKVVDTKNTLVFGEDKLVATVGVENLVIVNTKDAVLVAHKNESQKVKAIVQQLNNEGRTEAILHREVYRPWGKYDSVDNGERFQVKRITVKPGAKLSVQIHHHRAEHWIVVSGTAKVQIDDTEQYLTENESVYIPITSVHSLENPGKVDLELIEVQSGSYLGEDDIVRFDDLYGRVN